MNFGGNVKNPRYFRRESGLRLTGIGSDPREKEENSDLNRSLRNISMFMIQIVKKMSKVLLFLVKHIENKNGVLFNVVCRLNPTTDSSKYMDPDPKLYYFLLL